MSASSSSGTTDPATGAGAGWSVTRETPASAHVVNGLRACLEAHNEAVAGIRPESVALAWVVHAPDGEMVGGLAAEARYGWLHIRLLWVNADRRGGGAGSALLDAAERTARERGLTGLLTDTSSFQAPAFYRRHGFAVVGEVPDLPPGHTTYYLAKHLDAPAAS